MVSKEEFKSEVKKYAGKINVRPKQIRIRSLKHKNGSCSPRKVITFDTSVLKLDDIQRKETILHELLHLRYKNHGKLFKTVLKTYLE